MEAAAAACGPLGVWATRVHRVWATRVHCVLGEPPPAGHAAAAAQAYITFWCPVQAYIPFWCPVQAYIPVWCPVQLEVHEVDWTGLEQEVAEDCYSQQKQAARNGDLQAGRKGARSSASCVRVHAARHGPTRLPTRVHVGMEHRVSWARVQV